MPEDNSAQSNAAVGPEGHGDIAPVSRGEAEENSGKCKCSQSPYFSKRTKDLISLFTLIAVSVYTGITILILCNSTSQLAVSRDNEKRSLRAYAFPTPGGVENFSADKALSTTVIAKTMGATPAYKIRGGISVQPGEYPLQHSPSLNVIVPKAAPPNVIVQQQEAFQNSAFLSPGNTFILRGGYWALGQPTFDKINDGKTYRLYVWGRVDYEDVFKDPHWFTYCYAYKGADVHERQEVETCFVHNDDDHH